MNFKQVAQETAQVLQSYLTYQAVRIIIEQLQETNPGQGIWLNNYLASHNVHREDTFFVELMAQNKELLLRILTVRQELALGVLDGLPSMVQSQVNTANVTLRKELLERLTQASSHQINELE